jgi:GR25 family glycosyltransferase involved in LPS biosynthesis
MIPLINKKRTKMITVNEYFDKVFLLTLKDSKYGPQKLKDSSVILKNAGIDFEIYYGLDCTHGIPKEFNIGYKHGIDEIKPGFLTNKPGAFGCLMSHLGIIKIAKERGYENILVFEDDIALSKDFVELFSKKINDLPEDWWLIYLGGSGHTLDAEAKVTTKITDHISKTVGTSTTSSYAIHSRAFDKVINDNRYKQCAIDQFYKIIQNQLPCYVMRPNIAWQRAGYTDISNGCYRDYEGFMKEIE